MLCGLQYLCILNQWPGNASISNHPLYFWKYKFSHHQYFQVNFELLFELCVICTHLIVNHKTCKVAPISTHFLGVRVVKHCWCAYEVMASVLLEFATASIIITFVQPHQPWQKNNRQNHYCWLKMCLYQYDSRGSHKSHNASPTLTNELVCNATDNVQVPQCRFAIQYISPFHNKCNIYIYIDIDRYIF